MRAITLCQPAGFDKLHSVGLSDPGQPGAGEIRMRMHASPFNSHDLGVVTGRMPSVDGRIPMSDGVGVAEAIDEGVDEFAVGDSVVLTFFPTWLDGGPTFSDFMIVPGDGVDDYAREHVVRPAHWLAHAPHDYSHAEVTMLITAGLIVWRAPVVDARLKAGDIVPVLDAGGVSIFILQFAKSMGATVIVTSSSDDRLARAQALGADFTTDYRRDTDWAIKVLEYTSGRGVGNVIEVNKSGTLGQSIQVCRIGGHIVLIDVLTDTAGLVSTVELMRRHQMLQGLTVDSRRHQRDTVRAIDATGTRPAIDQMFVLKDIADAFAYQAAGKHSGKLCLSI